MESLNQPLKQKISYARASLWAPFYTVGMTVRVEGKILEDELRCALLKLQVLYPQLASRVIIHPDGTAWLTTENVGDLSFEVIRWTSENQWAEVFLQYEQIPFTFERGPIARFILLQGVQYTDVVAIVPHVLCDGYSMSQVMIDLVELLNFPNKEVLPPQSTQPVCWKNVHHSPFNNLILRGLARLVNFTWNDGRRVVRQEFYEDYHRHYWKNKNNRVSLTLFTPEETSKIVENCRKQKTSVTAALVVAFLMARLEQQPGEIKTPCEISVAVNIRDKLKTSPGRAFGVYASSFDERVNIDYRKSFWEMARHNYLLIHQTINNPERILLPLVLDEVDPRIMDSLLEGLSTGNWNRNSRIITHFVKIKGNSRCLDISNIGRIEVKKPMPVYPFKTILPFPPLVPGGGMAVNVITVNGAMSIILKYRQDDMNEETIAKIKNRVTDLILG